jgi:hypothetical protein
VPLRVSSIYSFIFPKNVRLKFRRFVSPFLKDSCNYATKLLILFFCSNILLAGTNHVICIELSDGEITKAHFQLYDCRYFQNSTIDTPSQYLKHNVSQFSLSGLFGATPSCPNCIDEHIQFEKSSADVDFATSILTANIPPVGPGYASYLYPKAGGHTVPLAHSFPLSTFRYSVIRTTVLLI